LKQILTSLAREAGFPVCAFAGLTPVSQTAPLHPQAQTLTGDARSLMPGAKCVMLLAMLYQPFADSTDSVRIDAYYLTSNRAHEAVQTLARRIEETLSVRALPSPPVFLKPLAIRSGLGEFGRNGLVSVGQYGTRTAIQAILLDAEIDFCEHNSRALSASCGNCRACVSACPVQALDGSGQVDISRCLRAQPEGEAFPEALRDKLGGSLLGCDLCQRVCPRNKDVPSVPVPEALRAALDLHALLDGQYKPLIPFLGKNNARRQRLTARALIAAANLSRSDLLPQIDALTECRESDMVRQHAQWAARTLRARNQGKGK